MNLKTKNKESLTSDWQKNFLAIYLALVIVVAINFLVFSYLLKDRENVQAFNSPWGQFLTTDLGNSNVQRGDTDVLIANFFAVDPWLNENVTCNWSLGNPCTPMVDADGTATAGAGTDNENISYFFQLEPTGDLYNSFFTAADGGCTDSLAAPACFYIDSDLDCDATTGTPTYILGNACGTAADHSVVTSLSLLPMWVHSESVNANASYDYGNGSAATETIWILNQVEDTVLYDGLKWDTNSLAKGIFQGDVAGTWLDLGTVDAEGYVDTPGLGYYNGDPQQQVVLDRDGDGYYEEQGDALMDADGSETDGIGTMDEVLSDGARLTPLAVDDYVCINTIDMDDLLSDQIIIYVDGNANCTPGDGGTDTTIRDDVGSGLLNTHVFPHTYFNAATFLVYPDLDSNGHWTWGNGVAATESLGAEKQDLGGWISTQHNILIEADGTGSLAKGADDDGLPMHFSLRPLAASANVCLSFKPAGGILNIEDIYIDGNNNCLPGDGGADTILQDNTFPDGLNPASVLGGTWANMAGTLMYHGDPTYAWGNSSATTYSLWTGFWLDGIVHTATFSAGDSDVYNLGNMNIEGVPLVSLKTAVGPTGQPLIYADADYDGYFSGDDTILEDIGTVQTGPAGAPNGVIDRAGDALNRATFEETGTATPNDVSSLKLYVDVWWLGMNGHCDTPGEPGADDIYAGDLTYDVGSNQWRTPSNLSAIPYLAFFRICVRADISPNARIGDVIISSIPEVYDANANGTYDDGDKGAFYWSTNDGPTGGPIIVPYSITITVPSYGSRVQDLTPPDPASEVNIKADSSGKVTLTWQDPADTDLAKIVIDETGDGQTKTYEVNAGLQTLVLENRAQGKVYTYKLRTQDTNGNLSLASVYTITVPITGEVTVKNPEIFPAPIVPGTLVLRGSEPAAPLPNEVKVGTLVKRSDMSSVYFIDEDNRRHAFPTEQVYFSWYADFSGVQTISAATLSAIPLGSNVTMRPGTYLLKIQSDSKVYAVEPYGVIRWVKTEQIATELFGASWSTRITDVEPTFFVNYQVGTDISTAVHPSGSVIQYVGSNDKFYIDAGTKKLIPTAVFSSNLFQDKFVAKNIPTSISYSAGAEMAAIPISTLMTLR